MSDKNHEDCNSFLMTILCHGDKHGHLLDKNKTKAWDTEEFVGDLSEVDTLTSKPKIILIQACRGNKKCCLRYNLYFILLQKPLKLLCYLFFDGTNFVSSAEVSFNMTSNFLETLIKWYFVNK